MLHQRRDRSLRSVSALKNVVTALWDRIFASDPGLLRLLMAARGTSAVFLMVITATMVGSLLQAAVLDFTAGIMFSMMAPFLMREPTRRQRQRTLVALAMPAALSALATTVLHGHGPLGDCFFLVLVFVCFLFQARSPQAIGQGLIAVVISYVGLYLELPTATLPIQMLSIVLAIPVTGLACFVVFPLRPAVTLRRMVQAVQSRAAQVLRDAQGLMPGMPNTTRRLQRSLARLNEAALAADDQLGVLDPVGSVPLRRHLMDLELAATRLSVATPTVAAHPIGHTLGTAGRHTTRLQVTERRLRHSRWSARDMRGSRPASSVAGLEDITRAAAALDSAAELTLAPHVQPQPAPPGPLAWRVAMRVTIATALAMAGGMALSPNRWFWAAMTVYVVFLNTRSRGDTIYKGVQRVAGTLMGLVGGIAIASLLQGDVKAEIAILLVAVFGMYYLFLISYTLGIFCVTVLLGIIYSLLGAAMGPLLVLRLEETAIGALAAIFVAVCVLPVRTRDQVGRSGNAVLTALAEVILQCRLALDGDPAAAPLPAMRAVDRQVADLRLALLPLTVGRLALRRTEAERPLEAVLDCAYWARVLALQPNGPDREASAMAGRILQRLTALASGDRTVPPAIPDNSGPRSTLMETLGQLDRATAALAERLAIGALHETTQRVQA